MRYPNIAFTLLDVALFKVAVTTKFSTAAADNLVKAAAIGNQEARLAVVETLKTVDMVKSVKIITDINVLKAGVSDISKLPLIYRGGNKMIAVAEDIKIGNNGFIERGLSLNINPNDANIIKYGGPNKILKIPEGLAIAQKGLDIGHFEIISTRAMTLAEYNRLTVLMLMK